MFHKDPQHTYLHKILGLHPESVFWFGIGQYFFGIWLTNTGGKLGKDFSMLDTISWCKTIHHIIYQPTRTGNLPILANPLVNRWDATL